MMALIVSIAPDSKLLKDNGCSIMLATSTVPDGLSPIIGSAPQMMLR